MIGDMGKVELFELCDAKQFQKCNAQNAFFIGIKELSIALLDSSWKNVKPANIFTKGDWTLSQSRTTSSRRGDLEVLGTAKLKHRKPTMLEGDVSKRKLKFAWTEETYIEMDKLPLEDHSYCPLPEEFDRYRKNCFSHWTDQAEMHRWNSDQTSEKQSQICTVSTVNLETSDLNQFTFIKIKGGIRRLLHPVPHGGSVMNTGQVHKLKIVDDLWAHDVIHVSSACCCCLDTLRLSSLCSPPSLSSSFSFSWSSSSSSMWVGSVRSPLCTSANEE